MVSRKLIVVGLVAGLVSGGCATPNSASPVTRGRSATPPPAAPTARVPPPPRPLPAAPSPQPAPASGTRAEPPPPAWPTPQASPSAGGAIRPVAAPSAAVAPQSPSATPDADEQRRKLRELHQLAAERYATIDAYTVQLRRREQVNGQDQPEEILLLKFRKKPWSIYFKWLGTTAQGREAVYVQGQHDNKLHTLLAAGDMPFMPAGKRIALAPDSVFVRSASRHALTEAGIGTVIEHFGKLVQQEARLPAGQPSTCRCQGLVQRPEFAAPVEVVEQVVRPGVEPLLPGGGRRLWAFDPASHLPVLIVTWDMSGHEVEYYCFTDFRTPVALSDADFDPNRLGKPPSAAAPLP